MKKVLLIALLVVMASAMVVAQVTQGIGMTTGAPGSVAPTVDVLGAHQNYGRGCAGCHAPHSGAFGAGGNGLTGTVKDPYSGVNALFAQDMGPLWGQTFDFSDISNTGSANRYLLATAANGNPTAMNAQQYSDMRGVVMCLACHDGAVAKGAMMQNWAFEEQIGALPTSYGSGKIPTLLGADGTTNLSGNNTDGGNYNNDHPIGENATVSAVLGTYYNNATNGLNYTIVNSDHHWHHLCRAVFAIRNFLRRAGPVEGFALLRNSDQRFEHTLHRLHDLPRPALDERVLRSGLWQPDRRQNHWNLLKVFLHQRPIQPGHSQRSDRNGRFHDPVLPPVPLWRVERSQWRNTANDVLTSSLSAKGEGCFLPFSVFRVISPDL